jgi:hypothetical protein
MYTLSQVEDGQAAWAEFFEGVTKTFEANEAALPVLAVIVLIGVIMVANIQLARWLARRSEHSGQAQPPSSSK